MYKVYVVLSNWEDLNTPFMATFNKVVADFPQFEVEKVQPDQVEGFKSYYYVRSTPCFVITDSNNQMRTKESGVIREDHMREIFNTVINNG